MPFQILSLSEGGYFGLYTASVLDKIEKQGGKLLADCFDLIAGTSVGGILAIAAADRVPMESVIRAFKDEGEKIGLLPVFRTLG